ncbi:hypothetical protein Syun_003505 [Stephania yunnanensis]|uniref:Uncharacterized protein n=1 Tax=Stephania yunnanensis TaxID=152371 RepID=A0AAP0L2S8_9MAGN
MIYGFYHQICVFLYSIHLQDDQIYKFSIIIANLFRSATSFTDSRNLNGVRTVHRKALLETLANELPIDAICYSSKLSRMETYTHKDSSIPILFMEDGTIIKAKDSFNTLMTHSYPAIPSSSPTKMNE